MAIGYLFRDSKITPIWGNAWYARAPRDKPYLTWAVTAAFRSRPDIPCYTQFGLDRKFSVDVN